MPGSSTIQIKRSTTTSTPSTLAAGELAFSNVVGGSGTLFIGSTDGASVVAIGGARYPGTLTANQALVANSTSGINRVYAANVDLSLLGANGSQGSAGQILYSGGTTTNAYWAAAPSTNVDAQYAWTNTQSYSNTITFNGGIVSTNTFSANGGVGTAGQVLTSGGAGANVYWTTLNGVNTAAQYSWSNTQTFSNTITFGSNILVGTTANAGSFTTGGGYGSTTGGAVVNATVVAIGNSTVNGSITSNATVTYFTGTAYTANNATNLGGVAAASYALQSYVTSQGYLTSIGGAGNVAYDSSRLGGTDAASYQLNSTLNANIASYLPNYAGVVNASSYTVGSNFVANSIGVYTTGTVNATSITVGSNFIANTTKVTFTGANIDATSAYMSIRDISVTGNLFVSGVLTSINTQQLTVNDNIIELGFNNTTTDIVDTGIYSPAGNATSIWYSGIARIAALSANNNAVYKIFASNTNPNTASTIDTSSNTATGSLISYLIPYGTGGAFVANSTVVNITANGTVSSALVANSLTLTTALAASYGGTGQSSYAVGDLLYASGTTALSKLSVPGSAANGQILQIVNNLPAYGTLDGGSF
jgi:hypothetical protein